MRCTVIVHRCDAPIRVNPVGNEPEIDDEPEEDDHGGGNFEDEGENIDAGDAAGCGSYGIDQSTGPLSVHPR